MKLPTLFLLLLFSFSSYSELLSGLNVVQIDREPGQATLVYLDSGRLLRLDPKSNQVEIFEQALNQNKAIELLISKTNKKTDSVIHLKLLSASSNPKTDSQTFESQSFQDFEPSVFKSTAELTPYFKELETRFKKDSICSNRAQIWTVSLWEKYQFKSMKAFLFFSRKYNRTYDHKWWYHVTPYVHVTEGITDSLKEYALDRTFTKRPTEMSKWVRIFMNNRYDCPEIQSYGEYLNGQETGWCYVRKVPMYAWMPWVIRKNDLENVPFPTKFIEAQTRTARNQALKNPL